MSKQPINPTEPELITRKMLIAMTGVSRAKIARIVINKINGFPAPCEIKNGAECFKAEEVKAWLKANNMKAIKITDTEENSQARSKLDNSLARNFITRKQGAYA